MRLYLRMQRIPFLENRIFRTIVHEMINTLKKADAEEILLKKAANSYAVIPEKFDCDYYRFLQGDPVAINIFQNDYMVSYKLGRNSQCRARLPWKLRC